MAQMKATILTADEEMYSGDVSFIVARALDGEFGLLPNHAPMIVALDKSPIRLDLVEGGSKTFQVEGGFLSIEDNVVSILTPACSEVATK